MIFFSRAWEGQSWSDPTRAAASLGLFAGHAADSCGDASGFYAQLPAPRAPSRRGWRVARSPSGWPVLLDGWIDDQPALQLTLGLAGTVSPELLYGAAVERWGDRADTRVTGVYAAVVALPDGTVRLSRSAWTAKSLFVVSDQSALLACSIPRPLFAAGLERRLRSEALARLLSLDSLGPEETLFEGIRAIEAGTVVRATRGKLEVCHRYDPLALAPIRLKRDEDYVEAANALLTSAVSNALDPAQRPGMMLSGGLDSPLVCAEVLAQTPVGRRVPSFTFTPRAAWDGEVPPHKFGDDRPYVEEFARTYPALDPHFCSNEDEVREAEAERLFLAADAPYPSGVLASVYFGPMAAARDAGCDWLLGADLGNQTFSSAAPWAWREFMLSGRWGELFRLAQARVADPRPVWRRIAAHAVMPLLPAALRTRIRAGMHGPRHDEADANPFLAASGALGHLRQSSALANNITVEKGDTREAFVSGFYRSAGAGAELSAAYEQVFGLRLRDVTAYRPLIEFCMGLPTGQFVRGGTTRYLARRMAKGRMPEAQRLNRLYGEHNVDWHAALTPQVPALRRRVAALANHPDLGPLIDTEAMTRTLDNWPETTPSDPRLAARLRFHLPAVLHVARYVNFATGRNAG